MKKKSKHTKKWTCSKVWWNILEARIYRNRGRADVSDPGHLRKLHFTRLKVERSRRKAA